MNWTGGDLSRAAANRRTATQNKQKAYFARARAGARQPRSREPEHIILSSDSARRATNHNDSSHRRAVYQSQTIDPIEYDLLQKRQELLRRPDWLRLEVTKPLRFHFASRAEKALIGRRRKLPDARSPARRLSAERRSRDNTASRLPDDRHALSRHALRLHNSTQQPTSSYHIKIGTGAFDSNTQPVVPPEERLEAELEDLSEEPMLLDSDDEVFEARFEQAQQHEQALVNAARAPNVMYQDDKQQHSRFVPDMRAILGDVEKSHSMHKSGSSFGSSLPWSTSIIDQSSSHIGPGQQVTAAPAKSAPIDPYTYDLGLVKDTRHGREIPLASILSAMPKPHTQQQRSSDFVNPPGNQQQPARLREPGPIAQYKDADTQMSSRVIHEPRLPHSNGIPVTKPTADKPTKDEEEVWRRFILGNSRTASTESTSRPPTRKLASKDLVTSEYLEPQHFTSEAAKYSTVATQGIAADYTDRASYMPDLSSVATMDKTTRAFMSSTPWH